MSEGEKRSNDEQQGQGHDTPHDTPTGAEWATFVTAAVVVLGVVGLIIGLWVVGPDEQPIIAAVPQPVRADAGQFYLPVRVENRGGKTVENVQVVAELKVGQHTEQGEQRIAFLSGGEVEEVAFVFSRSPSEGELDVSVASYRIP